MPEPKTGEHIRRSPGGGQLPFRGSTGNASPARTMENYQNDDSTGGPKLCFGWLKCPSTRGWRILRR